MKKWFNRMALGAFLLTMSAVQITSAATFEDVSLDDSNFLAVEYLVNIGTLEGYGDGTFLPDNTINRAELMKVLVAGQGLEPDENLYNNCFPDVEYDWYAPYVCFAHQLGWVDGYPDGNFLPGNTVNKVEAAKMVINALGLGANVPDSVETAAYMDTSATEWYAGYLEYGKSANLFEEEDYFYPTTGRTRGSTAENIFRALVIIDQAEAHYNAEVRDAFLIEEDMEDLLVEAGVLEEDEASGDDEEDEPEQVYSYTTAFLTTEESMETSEAFGDGTLTLEGNTLTYYLAVENLFEEVTGAHFHNEADGGAVEESIEFTGTVQMGEWEVNGTWEMTDDQVKDLKAGNIYMNVHTAEYPGGVLMGYLSLVE